MSAASKALPRPCPSCGEVSGGVFCPTDGTPLEGAFSLGGDRYVVEELIGNGAMAIVFGGRHRTLSRPVAVKILRPEVAENAEQQQRFLREARSASQLGHENIVGVLDFGWDDDLGVTYMVMERLFGQTLASQIGTSGAMHWREAVPLLIQICRGVGAAHGLGIVHRDLTSRNVILVSAAGRRIAKLCDFGLSRQTAGGDRVTHNGAWVGTPAYMAPEQLDSSPAVEASADIYSIGVLAHELLTGHFPVGEVGAISAVELVAAKLSELPRKIGLRFPQLGVPDELDTLVLRCLDLDPQQRPTAAELERAMVRIEARSTTAGAPASSATPPHGTASGTFPSLDDGTPTMIGSYRVVRSLGAGGTGRVYLGEHPVIGSKVAIKVLLPEIAGSRETVERFIQEARTSSQIDSPHIPRYYDFGRTAGGLPYAVMEYFEGETLAERIEKHGALSVVESADILGQVAGALTLAHEAGLVHRDLKPENIFLVAADAKVRGSGEHVLPGAALASGPTGDNPVSAFNVKVLDFGIAKTFGKESGTRTQQGFFLGTPFYCAPEQVFGAEVDPRADVYGLGATAFEMLTGLPPFLGEISEVLEAKTSREAPLLRSQRIHVSQLVEATVARMLARDPAARAPSMTWVKDQVARWLRPTSQEEGSSPSIALARTISQPVISLGDQVVTSREKSQPVIASTVAAAGSRAAGSAPVIALSSSSDPAAAVTQPGQHGAPYFIEAARPRRGDEPDFDALETVTMLPGSRAMVQITPPPPKVPVWRRPIPLAIAAAAIVGAVAVYAMGPPSGASLPSPAVAPPPKVSPIAAPAVGAAPPASSASPTAGVAAGQPAGASVDPVVAPGGDKPIGSGEDKTAQGGEPVDEGADDGKGERGERRGRHNKRDRGDKDKRDKRDRTDAAGAAGSKDPEPPKDVKFVDPFSEKP
jgi:eukaryotic-like serine/threonine-protein kinase